MATEPNGGAGALVKSVIGIIGVLIGAFFIWLGRAVITLQTDVAVMNSSITRIERDIAQINTKADTIAAAASARNTRRIEELEGANGGSTTRE